MPTTLEDGDRRIGLLQIDKCIPGQLQKPGFQSHIFCRPQQGVLGNLLAAKVIFMEQAFPSQLDLIFFGITLQKKLLQSYLNQPLSELAKGRNYPASAASFREIAPRLSKVLMPLPGK